MGMKTAATPPPAAAPAAAAPATEARKVEPTSKPATSSPRAEVKGQVAMHAIITGYEVASRMAATLAASPEKAKEVLHALAKEVAKEVEAYTFRD